MPLPTLTRQVLEYYTAITAPMESVWYGPWTTILTTLFPATNGFQVTPQCKLLDEDDNESTIPDVISSKFPKPRNLGILISKLSLL